MRSTPDECRETLGLDGGGLSPYKSVHVDDLSGQFIGLPSRGEQTRTPSVCKDMVSDVTIGS